MEPAKDQTEKVQIISAVQSSIDNVARLFGNSGAGAAFSSPVITEKHTVITAAESIVFAGNGVGGGMGPSLEDAGAAEAPEGAPSGVVMREVSLGGGGGSGGFSFSRPVAAITIGPEGVAVHSIIDWSKLGIAFVTTLGAMAFMLIRLARAARR